MKRCLLLLAAACAAVVTAGAQPDIVADRRAGRNVIGLSGGMSLGIADNAMCGPYCYLEYARNVKGRFWVGGRFNAQYNKYMATCAPTYWIDEYWLTSAYGIGYWEWPVTKTWLSFRAGGGVGLGLHFGSQVKDLGAAPYFLLRAEWVWHMTEHCGLTFAPLLIGPLATSQLEWSSLAPVTEYGRRENIAKIDFFLHIGYYVRF